MFAGHLPQAVQRGPVVACNVCLGASASLQSVGYPGVPFSLVISESVLSCVGAALIVLAYSSLRRQSGRDHRLYTIVARGCCRRDGIVHFRAHCEAIPGFHASRVAIDSARRASVASDPQGGYCLTTLQLGSAV